jgi:hypothetical protein
LNQMKARHQDQASHPGSEKYSPIESSTWGGSGKPGGMRTTNYPRLPRILQRAGNATVNRWVKSQGDRGPGTAEDVAQDLQRVRRDGASRSSTLIVVLGASAGGALLGALAGSAFDSLEAGIGAGAGAAAGLAGSLISRLIKGKKT